MIIYYSVRAGDHSILMAEAFPKFFLPLELKLFLFEGKVPNPHEIQLACNILIDKYNIAYIKREEGITHWLISNLKLRRRQQDWQILLLIEGHNRKMLERGWIAYLTKGKEGK